MAPLPLLSDAELPEDAPVLGAVPPVDTDQSAQGGFFARLFGDALDTESSATSDDVQDAHIDGSDDKSLPPETYGVKTELPAPRKSLFGLGGGGDAVGEVPPGTILPYGRIARVCGVPKRSLGKKAGQYPERRPQHVLYDSDPGNTGPHTFYLTGFDDGCVRQFTASLAVFGSIEMHEQLRYGLPSEVQPYSDTDKAYEKLKSRVCGVARKKPCGSRRGKLERNTVFLSIYERFGSNARWSNLLLHSGEVLAQDNKGG